jgi:chromosome partitioning protein
MKVFVKSLIRFAVVRGTMASPDFQIARSPSHKPLARRFSPQQVGDATLIISRDLNSRAQSDARVITFANEKGGVGKSTIAFHCCTALCNAGYKVAVVDLDYRQQSLARALENREGTARRLKISLPQPKYAVLNHQSAANLSQEVARIGWEADYILIDVAGHDSPLARHAMAMADTLVTPINQSFVDLDLLGQFDATTMQLKRLGSFARLVHELREVRDHRGKPPVDWVVVPNRLRRLGSFNEQRVGEALLDLTTKAGFRLAPSLGDRVAYRELFLLGLTVFDLKHIPDFARTQPAAKAEMAQMIEDLKLENTRAG